MSTTRISRFIILFACSFCLHVLLLIILFVGYKIPVGPNRVTSNLAQKVMWTVLPVPKKLHKKVIPIQPPLNSSLPKNIVQPVPIAPTSVPPEKPIQVPSSKPLPLSVPEKIGQPVAPPPGIKKRAKLRARLSTFGTGDINEEVLAGNGNGNLDHGIQSCDMQDAQAIAQRIAEIDRKQDLLEGHGSFGGRLQSNEPTQSRGQAQKTVGGKRPNIIAMTKCFLDNIDGHPDGNSVIDRDGDDETIAPSFEELKYISYEAKVTWSLQSAWKRNLGYRGPGTKQCAYVDFEIDQNGNIVSHTLLQSSGSKEADVAIMKNMLLAAPYPPLPKHFNVQTYRTGRRIVIVG